MRNITNKMLEIKSSFAALQNAMYVLSKSGDPVEAEWEIEEERREERRLRIILGVELPIDEDREVSNILQMLYFSYRNYSRVPYEIIMLEYYCVAYYCGRQPDW